MPKPTVWVERHDLGPIEVPESPDHTRADLEIYGIDHFCPSYTALVFLNATKIPTEELTAEHESFAGSFSIFGHQRCSGDEGHCTTHNHVRRFDDRPSHPLTRAFKRVVITDALRQADGASGGEQTVTLIVTALVEERPTRPLFIAEAAQIATFD
jgi:hypothetical protein